MQPYIHTTFNYSSTIFVFQRVFINFSSFLHCEVYPSMVTNYEQLIKINWTKFHICNLILIAYSIFTNKFTHQHFILKTFLNLNLYTWNAFISHVVSLSKTVNSLYKYSGSYLMTKNQWYVQNFQCVHNSILPNGKHIFPNS